MAKKITVLFCTLLLLFTFAACGDNTQDTANTTPPAGTDVVLNIEKEDGNDAVYGVGAELDPHFFAQNVGLSGRTADGEPWECKAEDWSIVEERVQQMNLKRIRVMLLPHWYIIDKTNTEVGIYNWDTPEMQSLYKILDLAKANGMKVNITMWGISQGTSSFMRAQDSSWVTVPNEDSKKLFVDCFADCVKYLIEEKSYNCIKEITLYNEPNSLYGRQKNGDYCDLCIMMDDSFRAAGIRDAVLFNLSDDARDYIWMAQTLSNLEGIIDVVNSHTYDFGDSFDTETQKPNYDMSNSDICYNNSTYNLAAWQEWFSQYNVPHIWGEFGTRNGLDSHTTTDKYSPSRGLDIARISLNFFNMGSVGMSYWGLFSQYYGRSDFNIKKIMDMGLWGFADEGYNCRPVYYSYSMLTRFVEEGDVIYKIASDDDYLVAVAFRKGDKWTYCVVNNSLEDKKVAFVNYDNYPSQLVRYEYDEANVPTDNRVIAANGSVTADGRVIADTVKARSFVVYTSK